MKRAGTVLIAIALVLWFAAQVFAGGGRVTVRSGHFRAAHSGLSVAPGPHIRPGVRHGFVPYGYPHYYHRHYYYPYGYYRYYRQPIIVLSPYHYYPYYAPAPVVVNYPFYCFAHQVGFVSRVGMLDHISGTHKIPLDTAASACPEGEESCIIDSVP